MVKKYIKKNKGFTLLVAIVTTSLLLIVSFAVINVAFKQLLISSSNLDSQYAFYATESGIECAQYWDLVGATSPFDPYVSASNISCNNQSVLPTRVVDLVSNYSTSTAQFNMPRGACFIVTVVKHMGISTTTKIDSRGYNTCAATIKRVERGITITY